MILNRTRYSKIKFFRDVIRAKITYKKDGTIKYACYYFQPFFNKKYMSFANCTTQISLYDEFIKLFPELTDFFRTREYMGDTFYILNSDKYLYFDNENQYNEFLKRYDDYLEEHYTV